MSRMLAALKRLESQQLLARPDAPSTAHSTTLQTIAESKLRIDQQHSILLPKSEFVPAALDSNGTTGCLSANAFWPSLVLPPEESDPEKERTEENEQSDPSRESEPLGQESIAVDAAIDSTGSTQDPATVEDATNQNETPRNLAMRQLASTILRKLPLGLPAALWITSAGNALDASGLVADLSRMLCEEESLRVLAVDAQCGRAAEQSEFGFAQAFDEPDRWQEAVRTTAVDGLSILSGGVRTTARAEPHNKPLKLLLERMCSEFDIVLFDGGAASQPAAKTMAADCDGTLVLVRLGETNRRHAQQVIKSLTAAKANVLGCVLVGA